MKRYTWILGLCIAGLTASCLNGPRVRHPHGAPPGQVKQVVHVHADHCGHVFANGKWVLAPGHSQGKGRGKWK